MHYFTVAVYLVLSAILNLAFSQSRDFHLLSVKKGDSLRVLNQLDQAELTYRQALVFGKKSVEGFKGLGKVFGFLGGGKKSSITIEHERPVKKLVSYNRVSA